MEFCPQLTNLPIILLFVIFFINFKSVLTSNCKEDPKLSNENCFNDLLIFNNMNYRAGHSALSKAGVFILEFSRDAESGARIFYGLNSNGRYYFPNEKPTKEITLEGKQHGDKTILARYESMNAFVALKDDINGENEYFLSISTFHCFMEIYDFSKENFEYDTIYTYNYFGIQIFSFKFSLLETKYSGEVIYYIIFCHAEEDHQHGEIISIKKLALSNLNFNPNDIVVNATMSGKQNERNINAFLVDDVDGDDFKILIVLYSMKSSDNILRYYFNVYQLSNLREKCIKQQLYGDALDFSGKEEGYGVFYKMLYLEIKIQHIFILRVIVILNIFFFKY